MDISCYSFIRMSHLAKPLMKEGGCLLTTTYYGGEKVVAHYGVMGPVKSALEGTVKYLAAELGGQDIRVNALSPGPIATRAAGGIADFDKLLESARGKSPEHENISIDGVGAYARFLVSDEARLVTGSIAYIDAGYHIIGG
jgi:enoyl-[acyl-carrier protein] reductase I